MSGKELGCDVSISLGDDTGNMDMIVSRGCLVRSGRDEYEPVSLGTVPESLQKRCQFVVARR